MTGKRGKNVLACSTVCRTVCDEIGDIVSRRHIGWGTGNGDSKDGRDSGELHDDSWQDSNS